MYKLGLISVLFFSGCSTFTINGTMCDQIASDPHATIPQECRNYNEEEAQKAYDNTKHQQKKDEIEQIIEFNKNEAQ
jgi:hypothetical protein